MRYASRVKGDRTPVHDKLSKTYSILLSNGRKCIVDEEDINIVGHYLWTYAAGYVTRNERKNGIGKTIKMHREIMVCPEGLVVDHINGDTLDNRKTNLRICTQSENIRNAQKRSPICHSIYKGVTKLVCGKWKAAIQANKKSYHIGTFKLESDAAFAYDKAAEKHHGEYAKLNRPYDGMYASLLRALDDFETKRDNASDLAEKEVFDYVSNQVKLILDDSPRYLKEGL